MSITNDESNNFGKEDVRPYIHDQDVDHTQVEDMEESNDEDDCKSHTEEACTKYEPQDDQRSPSDGQRPQHRENNAHERSHTPEVRLDERAAYKHSPPSTKKDEISPVNPDETNIIYATNISPVVTLEQIRTFFGFLGDIVDIALYHYEKAPETNFKVCFVEFSQHSSVLMAQHLTNTIFIDRAIFVLPYDKSKIPPNAEMAAELGYDDSEYVTNFNPGVMTQVTTGPTGTQVLSTSDHRLAASSLQQYPQLPMNTDPTRIEEIRRTLYIGNLDSAMNPEAVLKFFNDIGEVKYIRVAGDETQPTRFAFVEFTHQASVANALFYNGFVFGTRALKINHSNNPIVKPQPKLEIEDPSKKRIDNRTSHRDSSSRSDTRHRSSDDRRDRDRSKGYYDSRISPRDQRSRRSRSRESGSYSRSRRSRSREHPSRRDRSRNDSSRRRSRSRELSRRRRSRSRSSERRTKHKSSSRRR